MSDLNWADNFNFTLKVRHGVSHVNIVFNSSSWHDETTGGTNKNFAC